MAEVVENVAFHSGVTCGISGHDHPGQESVSSLVCDDGMLQWDYAERCSFTTNFAYFS